MRDPVVAVEIAVVIEFSLFSRSVKGGISTESLTVVVTCPPFRVVAELEGAVGFAEFPECVDGVTPEV